MERSRSSVAAIDVSSLYDGTVRSINGHSGGSDGHRARGRVADNSESSRGYPTYATKKNTGGAAIKKSGSVLMWASPCAVSECADRARRSEPATARAQTRQAGDCESRGLMKPHFAVRDSHAALHRPARSESLT